MNYPTTKDGWVVHNYENYSIWKTSKIEDIKSFKEYIYNNSETFLNRKLDIFNKINYSYKRDYSQTKNKKCYRLINPNGLVIITNNLRQFCDDNKLTYSTMSNLSRGIGKINKGWKCFLN